jgi:hypothetical protein
MDSEDGLDSNFGTFLQVFISQADKQELPLSSKSFGSGIQLAAHEAA